MADLFQSSIFSLNSAKLVLLSAGIIGSIVLLKEAIIPFVFDLILSIIPSLWISLHGYLSPPYIYIILNFIIIIIAALQHQNNTKSSKTQFISVDKTQNINHSNHDLWLDDDDGVVLQEDEKQVKPITETQFISVDKTQNINHSNHDLWQDDDDDDDGVVLQEDEKQVKPITDDVQEQQSFENPISPPTVQNRAEDTIDDTWKLIMEAQGKVPTRQLKKSETWDTPPQLVVVDSDDDDGDGDGDDGDDDDDDPVVWARRELRKSDTFSDRVSLRKEKSMSQDELNRRAEAFINKFNNEMRLQRHGIPHRHG